MDSQQEICPVCTLYLRPGITLKEHLTSHPKQKVIEALVRLSNTDTITKSNNKQDQQQCSSASNTVVGQSITTNQYPVSSTNIPSPTFSPTAAGNFSNGNFPSMNHSIIYQQFMSSSGPQPNIININPLSQQYITVPTVFNPQMMCPPYVYQQQQVIMSSGPTTVPSVHRPLPIEMPSSPTPSFTDTNPKATITCLSPVKSDVEEDENEDIIKKSDVEETMDDNCNDEILSDDMCITEQNNVQEMKQNGSHSDSGIFSEENENFKEQDIENRNLYQESVTLDVEADRKCFNIQESDSCNNDNYSEEHCTEQDDTNFNSENVNLELNKACQTSSTSTNQIHNGYMEFTSGVPVEVNNGLNFIEMDGMKLVLASDDFMTNQVISQVDEYECLDKSRILMTIGGMEEIHHKNMEGQEEDVIAREEEVMDSEMLSRESVSRESANIRTDERMPARGELSGQEESNECSDDIIWCKIQYNNDHSREAWDQLDQSCSADIVESPPTMTTAFAQEESYVQARNFHQSNVEYMNEDVMKVTTSQRNNLNECSDEALATIDYANVNKSKQEVKEESKKDIILNKRKDKLTERTIEEGSLERREDENNFDKLFSNRGIKVDGDIEASDTKLCVNSSCSFLCTLCNVILPSMKELKQHRVDVHKLEFKYKCATCDSVFQTEPLYTSHLQIHPLECKLCGKLFYRKQGMELHLKRHLGIKPYKCDICTKSFLTKQKREEHRNIHTGATPIKCNLCEETFRRYSNLIQHRNRHHLNIKKKLKDFICHCGEIFHSKKKLAWHKEIHELKPKACTYCSEKFLHMSSLTRHMRRAHNENYVPDDDRSKENVECPICKGVYLKSSLEMHIRNHSGQRPYTCLICNKSFTTKWNLKLHKWTHAARAAKPFKCEQCKGAFIRETDYIAHMNSHKSVKPYTCNYCGAQFIRKYNCQRHVREHEKDKTYVCEVCNKEFHRSYYLKDHMRIHTGIRPYSCSICGKTSTTKSNHNKHVRIHHAREPISTEN